jgi:hypothetical protein
VHVPRDLQELGQRLTPVTDQLSRELGRPPTIAELAGRLGVTEEEVLDAREAVAAHTPALLDERVSTEDQSATLGELLGADDQALDTAEDAILIEHYLEHLSPRNQMVLRLRFEKRPQAARDRRDPGRLADARLAPYPPVARATAGDRRHRARRSDRVVGETQHGSRSLPQAPRLSLRVL